MASSLESSWENAKQQHSMESPEVRRARALRQLCGITTQRKGKPLTHYELLKISPSEKNEQDIIKKADALLMKLRNYQTSTIYGSDVITELMNRVSRAKITLTTPVQRASYDASLQVATVIPEAIAAPPVARISAPETARPFPLVETLRTHWKAVTAASVMALGALGITASRSAPKEEQATAPQPSASAVLDPLPPRAPALEAHASILDTIPAPESADVVPPLPAPITPAVFSPAPEPAPREPAPVPTIAAQLNEPAAAPAEPTHVFDPNEYQRHRETFRMIPKKDDVIGVRFDDIFAFTKDPEAMSDPEKAKAILVESFTLAIQGKDLVRAHEAFLLMHEHATLFPKASEVKYIVSSLMTLAKDHTRNLTVITMATDDLKRYGYIKPLEAAQLTFLLYKKHTYDPGFLRERTLDQVPIIEGMLRTAQEIIQEDPELAEKYVREAKIAYAKMSPSDAKPADFPERVSATLLAIAEEQTWKKVNDALKKQPGDAALYRTRADLHLERGHPEAAVEDFAKSNHVTIAPLAQKTLRAATLSAEEQYTCAQEWRNESLRVNGKKRTAMETIARMCVDRVLASSPLDSFTQSKAEALRASFTPAQSAVRNIAPREWQSGLENINLKKYVIDGTWTKNEKGHLIAEAAQSPRILLPWQVGSPDNFDFQLELDVERLSGNNDMKVMLPLGAGVTLIINSRPESGGLTGLSTIGGVGVGTNPGSTHGMILPDGPHTLHIHLAQENNIGSVELRIDNSPILYQWRGDVQKLAESPMCEIGKGRIGFGAYHSKAALMGVRLQVTKGTMLPLDMPTPSGK